MNVIVPAALTSYDSNMHTYRRDPSYTHTHTHTQVQMDTYTHGHVHVHSHSPNVAVPLQQTAFLCTLLTILPFLTKHSRGLN